MEFYIAIVKNRRVIMLRSLYSGISGMKVNQTRMDVIGNNIANVGTTGFKSGRVRFQDMLSQSISPAMAPALNQGGVNASQVGLGVKIAGIDTMMRQGMMQPTGRNLDLGIDGEGFFIVGKGPEVFADNAIEVNHQPGTHTVSNASMASSGMSFMYSRDGSFTLDSDGNLLTSDGYRVMGYSLTNDIPNQDATSQSAAQVTAGGFDFQFGPGASLNGYRIVVQDDPNAVTASANVNRTSNEIVLSANFFGVTPVTELQLSSAMNKALSSAGFAQSVTVSGQYDSTAPDTSANILGGTPVQSIAGDGVLNFVDATKTVSSYDGSLKSLRIPDKIRVPGENIELRVITFSISKEGIINGVLEDGRVAALGQIAMASFKNPAGLSKVGGNLYEVSVNSGDPTLKSGIGTLGEDNSKGYGDALQGMLEMSNVDLAEQFTELIVTSRSFQAASRMITSGDEILQEIINLKR
jgi:flagellar hook protein FlgE